jgi:hypothetical protein
MRIAVVGATGMLGHHTASRRLVPGTRSSLCIEILARSKQFRMFSATLDRPI